MSSPRVSVVMPCFNLGQYVDEAVGSVLAQTFQDFEILLIDDGSTDSETRRLIDSYSRPRTRVIQLPHRGVVAARNAGIAEAVGEYLSFFDVDDRMEPQFLERTVEHLDAEPDAAFASCWIRLFGDEEWVWKPRRCDLVMLLHDCCVGTPTLVRRSAVLEVGGYDPAMELGHEDWDLWLSIAERGHRGLIIPEVLFCYRRRATSRSSIADALGLYLDLYRVRIAKHDRAYRDNLAELLWMKDRPLQRLLERVVDTEVEIDALTSEVARRQDAVGQLRAALDDRREPAK